MKKVEKAYGEAQKLVTANGLKHSVRHYDPFVLYDRLESEWHYNEDRVNLLRDLAKRDAAQQEADYALKNNPSGAKGN